MAPAIKELSRWLDANSEYYVAPDWADVVKNSVSDAFLLALSRSAECLQLLHHHVPEPTGFPSRGQVFPDPDGTSQQRSELSASRTSPSQ